MGRIHFPDHATMTEAQKAVFDKIISGKRGELVGPLRAALHNPELADRWQQLGSVLRFDTTLPAQLNELAILITARRWSSILEWAIHERDARKTTLDPAVIDSLRHGQPPAFGEDHAAAEIYDFVTQLLMRGVPEQAVYDLVRTRWGELGVVELTAVVGYYSMVAMTLNAHEIPLPEGVTADLPDAPGALCDLPARV
ncbi:carboxymuconolactone decarboxylase family protein [Pseudooceanicola sediminis]|uniref:Carboxymuconolactone decarboxylase family protein n=1 Tax=Pseudooceanicola sediminis TaxID=2211117 RepID=A0A399IVY3_9RHOB|nr:carboxymuconolactone decarboxylase family protein [Pseudooceanicola sediminis]KAA2312675.1 carboxymuconolactone decarboxylase family protein [Puniceibacterium sp. HSS470]RII37110.1 carboxymuconolactone decarboxylase family protein [Pseudooceanicola sediminis]|tara:strand:+ start:43582 stop:44172 length:591 start_codon:yes stop_codon:yes gene_type:complete